MAELFIAPIGLSVVAIPVHSTPCPFLNPQRQDNRSAYSKPLRICSVTDRHRRTGRHCVCVPSPPPAPPPAGAAPPDPPVAPAPPPRVAIPGASPALPARAAAAARADAETAARVSLSLRMRVTQVLLLI